ncbi:3-oxoacyl-ACP synthase III [Fimbriiglobus ruber]|uniref:3-oxoacyl-[ACP] synthase III in alkane synthesis cluster n=1 Tax=Fimbriiglobus ruber TaxID=1908690 RepID=A0A225DLN2_9BACT|nr:3-oxoacyl-ACP synthase III [Fimbriiglobus ruber]OWK42292.1 3-oxoacyl-[ACP] synthase III in alkane synthesis cluster [Fimbriiglobus ruber]
MHYNRVYIDAIGYELPPVVVSTTDLESRLKPFYDANRLPMGQLELLTGITERRWWDQGYRLSAGATAAGRKALATSGLDPKDVGILIYAGVCREQYEPATACAVAANLGISTDATVYDLSNACLGVLNGVVEVANRIELGQCKAGLVVSCESAREINELAIDRVNDARTAEVFRSSLATFTGGSGAVAVLVTSKEVSSSKRRRLVGGVTKNAPEHHDLCKWGVRSILPTAVGRLLDQRVPAVVEQVLGTQAGTLVKTGVKHGIDFGMKHVMMPFMETHAGDVLKFGVDLGTRTWGAFLTKFGWAREHIDKVICHQVGAGHRDAVLKGFGISPDKDFSTFPYLGNIGTVSLPMTAAIAEEREFLRRGDRVGWLGIGSGLNCLMLGIEW